MVGTTRSRVSFFMNRFRKLGFIDYDGGSALQVAISRTPVDQRRARRRELSLDFVDLVPRDVDALQHGPAILIGYGPVVVRVSAVVGE